MRIGLFSDVHGNHTAFAAMLDTLKETVEAYFFLGDLSGYYPFVNECLALWPGLPLWGVRGNHDQILLDCLANHMLPPDDYQQQYGSALARTCQVLTPDGQHVLENWPLEQSFTLDGVVIQLVHGAPWNPLAGRVYPNFKDWKRFEETQADVIAMGHTHYPFVKEHAGKLIVNPGSVGQARNQSGVACYAVLDLDSGQVDLMRSSYSPGKLIADARDHDPNLPYLVDVLTR